MEAPTGGLVGTTPFICGGVIDTPTNSWDTRYDYQNSCYILEENGEWKLDETAGLSTPRKDAAAVIINTKLIIAGGYNGVNTLETIEVVAPNTPSVTLPMTLPVATYGSCIVPWDNNTFMVIGGISNSGHMRESYFFNMGNETMTNAPSMLQTRAFFGCNEMIVNGESYIIVAGGNSGSFEALKKSSFGNGWKEGNKWTIVQIE